LGRDGGFQLFQVEPSLSIDAEAGYIVPFALELIAEPKDGVMLHGRGDEMVLLRPGGQEAADRQMIAFRAAAGEDNAARFGVHKRRDLLASALDGEAHLLRRMIKAGGVGVAIEEEREHGLHDLGGRLRRGVVIEVDEPHRGYGLFRLVARTQPAQTLHPGCGDNRACGRALPAANKVPPSHGSLLRCVSGIRRVTDGPTPGVATGSARTRHRNREVIPCCTRPRR